LPTESEWEFAAAGGSENLLYPWGSAAPDCTLANFRTASSAYCGPGGVRGPAIVGSYPAGNGKWGHADLAGNLWEWILDYYADYSGSATSNYANLTPSADRVIRGDCYAGFPMYLPAAARLHYDIRAGVDGFRCARTAQ
jgi:formylglycine-generating enzyme